jgi:hypothetical protein
VLSFQIVVGQLIRAPEEDTPWEKETHPAFPIQKLPESTPSG